MAKKAKHVMGQSEVLHALPAGIEIERQSPLAMRRMKEIGEQDIQHLGFLLWTIQPRRLRNRMAVARLVDRAETTMRQWHKRYRWVERAAFPEAQHWAIRLLKAMYPSMVLPAIQELPEIVELRETLEAKQEKQKPTEPTQEETKARRDAQNDMHTLNTLLRGALGSLAKEMTANNTRATIRDLPSLVRAFLLVNGNPTEIIAHVGDQQERVQESVRVKQARATEDESAILDAMREDLEEMLAVVDTLRTADNVVEFPKEVADGGE